MHAFNVWWVKNILAPLVVFIAERILGWRVDGETPPLDKFMLIAEPHTTNWDLVVMFYWACKQRRQVHYVIKKEVFNWPLLSPFFGWTGGIPMDRESPLASLKAVMRAAKSHERFILLIAPSGTRGYTEGWKPGFYYLAQKTGLPIVPSGPDYARKLARITAPIMPSGDIEADIAGMQPFYENMIGHHPENATPVRLLHEERAEAATL
ncbi:MAG: 1-acyl-sn-glycerol-3-phosphate acyltransferase [Phototrophicaceae bacterium]|jgi:1-acyl-sn-glycerol-3-phosphate acyltransferase